MTDSLDVMNVFKLENVCVRRGTKMILDGINWQVNTGERWVILGPNGAGKTTLVQILSGRMHPTKGTVEIIGETLGRVDLQEIRPLVGVASSALDERFEREDNALNVVLSSAYGYLVRGREDYEQEDKERALQLLKKFGVAELWNRRYGTLSTGEKKRVQIARALMSNPEIIILDEPASGLDLKGREELLEDLAKIAFDSGAPVMLLVTHHVEEIPAGFTHMLMLKDGKVNFSGSITETLSENNLSATFDLPIRIVFEGGRWTARISRDRK